MDSGFERLPSPQLRPVNKYLHDQPRDPEHAEITAAESREGLSRILSKEQAQNAEATILSS